MKKLLASWCIALLCFSSAVGSEYNRVPAGLIKGARLSRVSSDTIKIGPGYGESMGAYWEITPEDLLVTTGYVLQGLAPTANGVFHYIYVDRANSALPSVAITNSTSAPTWSADFLGWYDGNNRCIGVVRVSASGALANFTCLDDDTYVSGMAVLSLTSVNAVYPQVWYSVDCTNYMPVNVSAVRISGHMWWTGGTKWSDCQIAVRTHGSPFSNWAQGVANAVAQEWFGMARGADRSIDYQTYASSTQGETHIDINAYRIER